MIADTTQLDWRHVWALFAKHLPVRGLQALAWELDHGGKQLCRDHPVLPLPDTDTLDGLITRADPIAFALWKGSVGLFTVREVICAWNHACFLVGQDMGDESGCRYFFCFWDEEDLARGNALLLVEVRLELLQRGVAAEVLATA